MGYTPKFFGCDGLDGILNVENFDASLAEGVMLQIFVVFIRACNYHGTLLFSIADVTVCWQVFFPYHKRQFIFLRLPLKKVVQHRMKALPIFVKSLKALWQKSM